MHLHMTIPGWMWTTLSSAPESSWTWLAFDSTPSAVGNTELWYGGTAGRRRFRSNNAAKLIQVWHRCKCSSSPPYLFWAKPGQPGVMPLMVPAWDRALMVKMHAKCITSVIWWCVERERERKPMEKSNKQATSLLFYSSLPVCINLTRSEYHNPPSLNTGCR